LRERWCCTRHVVEVFQIERREAQCHGLNLSSGS
jgi:hypothetical protein